MDNRFDTDMEHYVVKPRKLNELLSLDILSIDDVYKLLNSGRVGALCQELNANLMLRSPVEISLDNSMSINRLRVPYRFVISPFDLMKRIPESLKSSVIKEQISSGISPYEFNRDQLSFEIKQKYICANDILVEESDFNELISNRCYISSDLNLIILGNKKFDLSEYGTQFKIIEKISHLTKDNSEKWVKKSDLNEILGPESESQALEKIFRSKMLKELRKLLIIDNGETRKLRAYRLHPSISLKKVQ